MPLEAETDRSEELGIGNRLLDDEKLVDFITSSLSQENSAIQTYFDKLYLFASKIFFRMTPYDLSRPKN